MDAPLPFACPGCGLQVGALHRVAGDGHARRVCAACARVIQAHQARTYLIAVDRTTAPQPRTTR